MSDDLALVPAQSLPPVPGLPPCVLFIDGPPVHLQAPSEHHVPDPLLAVVPTWQLGFDTLPASFDDVAFFVKEVTPLSAGGAAAPGVTTLDHLAVELAEHVDDAWRAGSPEGYAFDLDVPGFGRMEGRLTIRRGQADLELHALRHDAAALLRARLHQLQGQLDRESAGDVNLFIV